MTIYKTGVAVFSVLAVCAFWSQAQAQVDAVYPGSACQPVFGGEKTLTNTLEFGLYNTVELPIWVTCPAIRDWGNNSNPLRASVFIAQPATSTTSCVLHKIDTSQNDVTNTSSVTGTGFITLQINEDASATNMVNITCLLAVDAILQGYNYYDDVL